MTRRAKTAFALRYLYGFRSQLSSALTRTPRRANYVTHDGRAIATVFVRRVRRNDNTCTGYGIHSKLSAAVEIALRIGLKERGKPAMGLDQSAVSTLRREFPALAQQHPCGAPIIFFDGPGGTQVHESVLQAMERHLVSASSNAHGAFLYSHRTDETTYEGRVAMADFLNAPSWKEIVFGPNMTTLTFRISQAIGDTLKAGDEIVVTRLDHDANISPWAVLERTGIRVRRVDFSTADCTLDLAHLSTLLNERTRVVAIGYASNAVGTVNDVRWIASMAHDAGAMVFVDAVHYAPHGPIDVTELGCDFLVCSAYKFFGPHLGVLWGRYDLLEELPARKVVPAGDFPPDKFETGTNNFEAIAGSTAAVNYLASVGERYGTEYREGYAALDKRRQSLKAGMAAIRDYEKALCQRLLDGVTCIPGVTVHGITDPERLHERVPTVSITMEDRTANEVARFMDEHGIFVWDGHFYAVEAVERLGLADKGGLLRIGPCHYNTYDEADRFVATLELMRSGRSVS